MNDFLIVLFIALFLFSINFIAYYTSKLRKLEKNHKYFFGCKIIIIYRRKSNVILE